MNRNNLHTYHLRLTTLSPVHIGTGEVYEPTNFVIDEGKLFSFDEVLFYQSLNPADKREFGQKSANWMYIIDFYRSKAHEAKKIAKFSCNVSKKVEETYKKLYNADGSKKQNQFQIAQTFKNPNTYRVVIPGSSIKGMFDTVLGIYPKKVKDNEPRQRLILSDALLLEGTSEIGYAYRKHKTSDKTARSEIPQMVEIIAAGSTFVLSVTTEYSFAQLQERMQSYHGDRQDSKYTQTSRSFVARVGKFCGKEYMVDDGKNVRNTYDKPVATHTLYENDDPFGWIEMEKIDKESYEASMKSIAQQERSYYIELEERQKEILESIAKEKEKQKKLALEKAEREKKEAEAKAKEEAEKRKRLASMTPVQRLVDSYDDIAVLVNDMKAGQIEDFESIKQELAAEVKKELQKNPKTWEKAKQKAAKRKQYIQGILGE